MSKHLRLLLALVALAAPAASGFAQDGPALALFGRMIEAERTHAFQGRLVEEIRFPEPRPQSETDRFRYPPTVTPRLVVRNFQMVLGGREAVAGRPAQILPLVPRNGVSPTWTFWVDIDTGLRLAYEQRDAGGRLLATGRYLRVDGVVAFDQPRPLPAPEAGATERRLFAALFAPEAIPDGFLLAAVERTRLGDEAQLEALRFTFWDGLNSLVLLVYPRQRQVPERDYLASLGLRLVTLSALGPVPQEALLAWLERLADGPARRITRQQLQRLLSADLPDG